MIGGINKNCCFLGHRKIDKNETLETELRIVITDLIEDKGIDIFFFGSKSQFDRLCHTIVSDLKKIYPPNKGICCNICCLRYK